MSIKHTILGFLSWQPSSGYDLKKIVSEMPFLPWSGNNNQIYTTLVQLHDEGLVTLEVQNQASGPSKKIYYPTPAGLAELKAWLHSLPEPSEYRVSLLMQLAWADHLNPGELDILLDGYEQELQMHLYMQQEQNRRIQQNPTRNSVSPARTERETLLWNALLQHHVLLLEAELKWLRKLRGDLSAVKPKAKQKGKK